MQNNRNPICQKCGQEFKCVFISQHGLSTLLKCECCELTVATEEVSNLQELAVFINMAHQVKAGEIFAIRRGKTAPSLVGNHIARNDEAIQEYFL